MCGQQKTDKKPTAIILSGYIKAWRTCPASGHLLFTLHTLPIYRKPNQHIFVVGFLSGGQLDLRMILCVKYSWISTPFSFECNFLFLYMHCINFFGHLWRKVESTNTLTSPGHYFNLGQKTLKYEKRCNPSP